LKGCRRGLQAVLGAASGLCRYSWSQLLFTRHRLGASVADEQGLVRIIAEVFNGLGATLLHGGSAAPEAG